MKWLLLGALGAITMALAVKVLFLRVETRTSTPTKRPTDSVASKSSHDFLAPKTNDAANQSDLVKAQKVSDDNPTDKPTSVEESKSGTVWKTMLDHSSSTAAVKSAAVLRVLRESGAPDAEMARAGTRLARALESGSLASDWNCHQAGCYFVLTQDDHNVMNKVVSLRDENAHEYVISITNGTVPNKLAILMNFKQE